MIEKVPSGLSISDYRRNRLRYVRGDRGREPSYPCDAVDVRQIDLNLAQSFGSERQGVRLEWCGIKGFFSGNCVRRGLFRPRSFSTSFPSFAR
jgi:hypothetical protein